MASAAKHLATAAKFEQVAGLEVVEPPVRVLRSPTIAERVAIFAIIGAILAVIWRGKTPHHVCSQCGKSVYVNPYRG